MFGPAQRGRACGKTKRLQDAAVWLDSARAAILWPRDALSAINARRAHISDLLLEFELKQVAVKLGDRAN